MTQTTETEPRKPKTHYVKKLDKEQFMKCLELFIEGKVTTKVCAQALNISEPTFKKRANQVLLGEHLDEDMYWLKEGEVETRIPLRNGKKNKGYTFNKDCKRWQEQKKFRKLKASLKNIYPPTVKASKRSTS